MKDNHTTLGGTSILRISPVQLSMKRAKLMFLAMLLAMLFLGTLNAEAANHYVRAGASGNGDDWTSAFGTLPSSLIRGDTYFIAAGSYGNYTFDDGTSGATIITIKKATVADHGINTGWQDTYGDGQATFGYLLFTTGYYTLDGVTRNESNWQDSNSYGFRITSRIIANSGSPSNVTLRYVDIGGNVGTDCTASTPTEAIYIVSNATNWTVSRSHLHNVQLPVMNNGGSSMILEYSHVGPSWAKEAWASMNTSGCIIRHNRFIDNLIYPTAACSHGGDGGTADIWARATTGQNDNWEIYGNVFGESGNYTAGVRTNAVVLGNYYSGPGDGVSGWKVYNNTFYNIGGSQNRIKLGNGTGNVVANNLWYKSRTSGQSIGITTNGTVYTSWCYSYPYSLCPTGSWILGTEDPFVNAALLDFRLKSSFSGPSPVNAGVTLGTGFRTLDGLGNTRGIDGAWDIGAYEYVSGGGGGPVLPSPPLSLTIQ